MDIRGAEMHAAALFNSESYVGDTLDGRYHGFGRVTYANGNEYCGQFVEGRMAGLGTMVWNDGLKYVGEWRRNVASGVGCLSWANGTEYYGDVDCGKRHGAGVQIQGAVRYSGEWHFGKRHGFGTLQSPATEYAGEWAQGRRHGWGCVRFRNGNCYEGMWADDKMAGFGMMRWVTSTKWAATAGESERIDPAIAAAVAAGATGSNYREAVATLRRKVVNVGSVMPGPLGPFTPAVMASTSVAERYVGEWQDNAPHGKGEYDAQFFSAGSSREIFFCTTNRFVGEFEHGLRHGFGTQFYADGTIYEGEWRSNTKHGAGAIVHPDGSRDDVEMDSDTPKLSRPRRQPTAKPVHEMLQVDDLLAPDDNASDVLEVIALHRNTLKHVYAVYCTVAQPIDFDAALQRLLEGRQRVPLPAFAARPSMQRVEVPTGYTPLQRNALLTRAIAAEIDDSVKRASHRALERIVAASDEFTKATSSGGAGACAPANSVIEGHVPTEAEIAVVAAAREALGGTPALQLLNPNNSSAPADAPRSESRGRRSATPLDGVTRTVIEPPPEMPPAPIRRERQAILTMHQFFVFLEDALLTDANCRAADVARIVAPALTRRKVAAAEEASLADDKLGRIQMPQFIEALVRVADYKLSVTEPFFASCSIHKLSLAQRLRYVVENFVVPLSSALRELDGCSLLREMGVDSYISDTACDTTLEELRRQAIRAVRDMTRIQNARGAESGAAGAATAGIDSPTTGPDARPISAGADGLELVQVPFVSPPEVIVTDVIGRRAVSAVAAVRGADCRVECVVVLVKISPGHIRKRHVLIVQRIEGVASFGGIVPEYQIERVQKLFGAEPWFVQRGLPVLRPRHLLQYLPVAEIIEGCVMPLHALFTKLRRQQQNEGSGGARLGLLLDALLSAGLVQPPLVVDGMAQCAPDAADSGAGGAASLGPSSPATGGDDDHRQQSISSSAGDGGLTSATTNAAPVAGVRTPPSGDSTKAAAESQLAFAKALRQTNAPGSDDRVATSFAESMERVSLSSVASIAPSQHGQLLGMLTADLPQAIQERRIDALLRNVLFSCLMFTVTDHPRPCISALPPSAQRPVSAPKDPGPQLKQLYKACPELLEAVNLRAAQETSRNAAKKAFASGHVPVGMAHWQLVANDVELTFDQFLMAVVAVALLVYATDDATDVMAPARRIPELVQKALATTLSRDVLAPAADPSVTVAKPPLRVPPRLPVKLKPPPKDDSRSKKKPVPGRK